MSTSSFPYIGSKISLISKSEIRYEGTLSAVDPENATVTLDQVRALGTENRRRPDGSHVPPSTQVYHSIIFRGSDIKDLNVSEPPPPIIGDPAIVSANLQGPTATESTAKKIESPIKKPVLDINKAAQQHQSWSAAAASKASVTSNISETTIVSNVKYSVSKHADDESVKASVNSETDSIQPNQNRTIRKDHSSSNSRGKGRIRSATDNHQTFSKSSVSSPSNSQQKNNRTAAITQDSYDIEFDFEESNSKFEKVSINSSEESNSSIPVALYDKNVSFFDNISTDKNSGEKAKLKYSEEHKLNYETFGKAAPSSYYGYKSRGSSNYRRNYNSNHGNNRFTNKDRRQNYTEDQISNTNK